MATITSANSVFLLNIPGVTAGPTQLQGFRVDDAFTNDMVDAAEIQVGVDGYGVAGYVPRSVPMTIGFLASAASALLFENWLAVQDQLQDVLYAAGNITFPSLARKYTLYTGTLVRASTLSDARKVLMAREFHITWLPNGPIQAISAAPL